MSLWVERVASDTRVARSNACGVLFAAAANTSGGVFGAPAKSAATPEWFSDADPLSAGSPRLGFPCASTQAKLPCFPVATLTSQRKRGSSGEVKLIVPIAPRLTASASLTAPDDSTHARCSEASPARRSGTPPLCP